MSHPITVGTIFEDQWGYDQTNVDFYQVVAVTPATVMVRPIADRRTGTARSMCGHALPRPNQFTGPARRKRPYTWRDHWYIRSEHGSCRVWDGQASYYSTDH